MVLSWGLRRIINLVKEALKYFFDLALEFNLKYNRNNLEYDMFLTCIDETLVSSEMYIH